MLQIVISKSYYARQSNHFIYSIRIPILSVGLPGLLWNWAYYFNYIAGRLRGYNGIANISNKKTIYWTRVCTRVSWRWSMLQEFRIKCRSEQIFNDDSKWWLYHATTASYRFFGGILDLYLIIVNFVFVFLTAHASGII